MIHTEIDWQTHDGIPVYAEAWQPENDTRAVICLLHGLGEYTSRYNDVAHSFTRNGYILFGADMRGHGRTKGKRGHIPSKESILQDIDLLLENADSQFRNLPLFLYELVMWENAYHELHKEPEKDKVIGTMVSWIEEQL